MSRVDGEGPATATMMYVGSNPGWKEARAGRPFVGETGDEVERHIEANGLPPREQCFLTNLCREYKGKDYHYTAADTDEPALLAELERVWPRLIVPFGREAIRWFLGDVDVEGVWGVPWHLPATSNAAFLRIGSTPIVFPMYHPAAGLRNPEISPYVAAGFAELSRFCAGILTPRTLFADPIQEPQYEEVTTDAQLAASLQPLTSASLLAIDTEGWPAAPWSLQWCLQPGRAYCLRAGHSGLLRAFTRTVHHLHPTLLFHSALHDLAMLRSLGCGDLCGLPFHDTLIMAYLLQLEPRGLKALCLRHCNMQMEEYTDVVGDIDNELMREYLTWLLDAEENAYEDAQYAAFDAQIQAGRRLTTLPTLPKTSLHRVVSRVLRSARPAALWHEQTTDSHVAGYRLLGPVPQATLGYVQPHVAIRYGSRDADGTLRVVSGLSDRLDRLALRPVYDLERHSYPFIDRMQHIGLKPDLVHFSRLSTTLAQELVSLQTRLSRDTGRQDFNANSGDQVAAYLFDTLKLDILKRTQSGRGSTNDKVLEALEHEHPEYPVVSTIRAYREYYKLRHTFVDRLPDFVHRWPYDGRVHATFRTTRVVTGRLAASDPNVLAQPEHGRFAKDFKRGWIAESGHVLCQWDESQLELRTLAHLSQDPTLLAVYRGERRNPDGSIIDLHAQLAQRIFGVAPKDQHKSKHRLPAKTVNFLIPMGGTAHGLQVQLRANGVEVSLDDAQRWLDETMVLYTQVPVFMQSCVDEAQRNGYIRWGAGRIRYIGGIRSRDERVRAEAERFSFSTKIQGLAAELMKRAEATIYQDILVPYWQDKRWVEPILQVHDCIKLECEEGLEQDLHVLMTEAMTHVPKGFSVPLAVEGEFGFTMADMETF